MEEKDQNLTENTPEEKTAWQQTKEGWYDKVPLTVRQLDIIIGCAIGALILVSIVIALDAMGVF